MTIVIAGSMPLRADARERGVAAFAALAAASRRESGCEAFAVAADLEDDLSVLLFEAWASQEALDAHRGSEHVRTFAGIVGEVLGGPPSMVRYEVRSSGPFPAPPTALGDEPAGADRVRTVFARVAAGDRGVADLYAPDGVIEFGDHGRVEGREAIRAFYGQAIDALHPQPAVQLVLEEAAPLYVAIVDVPTDGDRQRAVDLFELGDDGIRRLEMFTRNLGRE